MAEYCTCGAELPPDARFCHKCGKPQREEPLFEPRHEDPPAPVAVLLAAAAAPEISFHNRMAVRTAFLAATLASLLISFPMPVIMTFLWLMVWLLAAGSFAVYLYVRRTGQGLSVRSGFRLGWITGVFCFVIATVFFTISVISIAGKGGLVTFYRQQLTGRTPADVNIEQMLTLLESPAGLTVVLLSAVVLLFVIFTLVPTIGGALGAKVMDRRG